MCSCMGSVSVLNTDVAAQICKVSHYLKFLLLHLNLWVFFEVHAHDSFSDGSEGQCSSHFL